MAKLLYLLLWGSVHEVLEAVPTSCHRFCTVALDMSQTEDVLTNMRIQPMVGTYMYLYTSTYVFMYFMSRITFLRPHQIDDSIMTKRV